MYVPASDLAKHPSAENLKAWQHVLAFLMNLTNAESFSPEDGDWQGHKDTEESCNVQCKI